jgi:hypothetical protein
MTDLERLRELCETADKNRGLGIWDEYSAHVQPADVISRYDRLQAAERDAARYRWLRANRAGPQAWAMIFNDDLERHIDAAHGAQDTPGDA